MRNAIVLIGGGIIVIAIGLLLVVGVFWILDVAPLLMFLAVAGVYLVLSSKKMGSPSKKTARLPELSDH